MAIIAIIVVVEATNVGIGLSGRLISGPSNTPFYPDRAWPIYIMSASC